MLQKSEERARWWSAKAVGNAKIMCARQQGVLGLRAGSGAPARPTRLAWCVVNQKLERRVRQTAQKEGMNKNAQRQNRRRGPRVAN